MNKRHINQKLFFDLQNNPPLEIDKHLLALMYGCNERVVRETIYVLRELQLVTYADHKSENGVYLLVTSETQESNHVVKESFELMKSTQWKTAITAIKRAKALSNESTEQFMQKMTEAVRKEYHVED